nr:hypothetical protein [Bacilli bacterium]
MVSLLIFDAALVGSVAVHELGHAVMATILRVPVSRFRLGFGPRLVKIGVLDLRLVPITGEVQAAPAHWWQGVLIALAGVGAQWGVIAGAMVSGLARQDVGFWAWMLGLAMVGTLQLVPVFNTDGAVAISWWRDKNREVDHDDNQ